MLIWLSFMNETIQSLFPIVFRRYLVKPSSM